MPQVERVEKSAVLSKDRLYRYVLTRTWGDQPPVCFIGLNPSTADEEKDDQTIRKEIAFAKAWGRGGIIKLNLFAWRATKPADMFKQRVFGTDIIGPKNLKDDILEHVTDSGATFCVAAWGTNPNRHWGSYIRDRGDMLTRFLSSQGISMKCLDVNNDGSPKHTLYIPLTMPIHPWRAV